MASFNYNSANIKQSIYNDVYDLNDTTCISSTKVEASNNTNIITNSNVNDVSITAKASVDSTCVINNSITDSIGNQFTAQAQQDNTTATDFFNDLSYSIGINILNQEQTAYNNITNINQSTCGSNESVIANNNFTSVSNSTANNIYIDAEAVNSSNCTIGNMINQETYNGVSASADQSNTDIGMIVMIAIAIIIVVVIGGIIVVLLFGRGASATVANGGTPPDEQDEGLNDEEVLEAALGIPESGGVATAPPPRPSASSATAPLPRPSASSAAPSSSSSFLSSLTSGIGSLGSTFEGMASKFGSAAEEMGTEGMEMGAEV